MMETPAYQVVARRYRPQRFDELVGQEHVARGFSGAIESGRIGHAYLLTGARGVGKTSAARIFAKALQCEAGPAAEPCNACDACRAISAGQDVDVVEIDAASNRGVDEIRQLRQNVAVRPARGRFKVYIIDEVHMLTREAFNALLKTLEEPPSHVKFVLCTTEPDKLPITILSRCQRFDFATVAPAAIARRLAQIVEAEGIDVSAEALSLIARRAAGSMRDSQSLLEQLLGGAGGPIGIDEVHALIGTGREERVGAIVTAIVARDAPAALAALDAALHGGADPGGVLDQLVAALRDGLLASVGCGPELMQPQGGLGVDLAAAGRQLGTATVLAMLQILDQTLSRMATSSHAAVLAEMAIIRLATLEDLDSLSAAVDAIERTGGGTAQAPREKKTPDLTPRAVEAVPTARPAVPREPVAPSQVEPPVQARTPASPESAQPEPQPEAAAVAADTPAVPPLPADPMTAWLTASEQVGGLAHDFAAMAVAATWKDETLEVQMPATAAAATAFLSRPEMASGIGRALAEMAGRVAVFRLVTVAAPRAEPAAESGQAGRPAEPASRAGPAVSQAALVREASEHPLVAKARTVFDAAIRRVEPARRRVDVEPAEASGGGVAVESSAGADDGPASASGEDE
ncbi:MAG: polymerase subunit tau [Planctomycetota bacterium]